MHCQESESIATIEKDLWESESATRKEKAYPGIKKYLTLNNWVVGVQN